MLKFARLLRCTSSSRHPFSESLSYGRPADNNCLFHLSWPISSAGISTSTGAIGWVWMMATCMSCSYFGFWHVGYSRDRIYAPFSIFKGKAALSLSPVLPTFTKLESGAAVVDRRGSVMVSFLPAVGERKYDSQKKQVFALSATELGSLISLGPKESCEFFHDPSMKGSNAGQVRKSLSVKPHTDGSGYFISLTVVNNVLKTRDTFSVPVTTAEFAVMKTACSFALPHIMGWDRMTQQQPRSADDRKSKKTDPQLIELEWEK